MGTPLTTLNIKIHQFHIRHHRYHHHCLFMDFIFFFFYEDPALVIVTDSNNKQDFTEMFILREMHHFSLGLNWSANVTRELFLTFFAARFMIK